jgi:site-specific DNA-cytosine methylase
MAGATDGIPAISLFSRVGGLDLGVSRAGFSILTYVENEPDAVASLRANQFVGRADAVLERSILDVPTEGLLREGWLGGIGTWRPTVHSVLKVWVLARVQAPPADEVPDQSNIDERDQNERPDPDFPS